MEFCAAERKKELLPFATAWMELESIMLSDNGVTRIKWSKNSLFNQWCWDNWTGTCKKKKKEEPSPPNYTIHQNKLKMDKRLNYKL